MVNSKKMLEWWAQESSDIISSIKISSEPAKKGPKVVESFATRRQQCSTEFMAQRIWALHPPLPKCNGIDRWPCLLHEVTRLGEALHPHMHTLKTTISRSTAHSIKKNEEKNGWRLLNESKFTTTALAAMKYSFDCRDIGYPRLLPLFPLKNQVTYEWINGHSRRSSSELLVILNRAEWPERDTEWVGSSFHLFLVTIQHQNTQSP